MLGLIVFSNLHEGTREISSMKALARRRIVVDGEGNFLGRRRLLFVTVCHVGVVKGLKFLTKKFKNRVLILYNFELNNLKILLDCEETTRAIAHYHPCHRTYSGFHTGVMSSARSYSSFIPSKMYSHSCALWIRHSSHRLDLYLPCPAPKLHHTNHKTSHSAQLEAIVRKTYCALNFPDDLEKYML